MSINKVILIGNVGQDPEVRYVGEVSNGTKVATLRIATSEKYRDKDGNIKENTEWHNVIVWRQLADVVEKYVKKGTQLYIEGKLKTRSWDDKGVKRYSTDVVADTLQMLGKKEHQPDSYIQGARQMAEQRPATTPIQVTQADVPDDDLPF